MAKVLQQLKPDFEAGTLIPPEEKSFNTISIDQAPDAYSGKIKRAVIVFE